MKRILARLARGMPLLSDGAWGTSLYRKGLRTGECPDAWSLTHPDDVLAVARSYVEAGADVIGTNSFGANRWRLASRGLADRVAEINEAAAALSRRAAGPDGLVMGSIGPTGVGGTTGAEPEERVYEAFREQATALERGGADAACIETMYALGEALLAIRAVRENTALEVVCTFTFERTASGAYRTMMGVTPGEMARVVWAAGADVIGANCGNGITQMVEIAREMRAAAPEAPILVQANAGLPVTRDGELVYPESPEETAGFAPALLQAGARIIGGCCGTGPDHIRALRRALDS